MHSVSNLQGKVALITGGAVRIGREISRQLARAGCQVCVHYNASAQGAESLLSELRASGVRCEGVRVDLSNPDDVTHVVGGAMAAFGRVDILINNAAIFLDGDLKTTSLENWQQQFAINLTAPFLISKDFAALAGSADGRCIVNILDARVNRPGRDHFAYRLTKAALLSMTESLALDLSPSIRVNGVALGAILPPPEESQAYLDELAESTIPLARAGNPEMVAENVLHLLSQPFLTGEIIRLDGGEFL